MACEATWEKKTLQYEKYVFCSDCKRAQETYLGDGNVIYRNGGVVIQVYAIIKLKKVHT